MINLAEWLKWEKKIGTSNAHEYVEKLDHSYTTGGNVKLYSPLKNSLALSYKSEHVITIRPSNCTLGIYSREIKVYVYTKPVHECSEQLCS